MFGKKEKRFELKEEEGFDGGVIRVVVDRKTEIGRAHV